MKKIKNFKIYIIIFIFPFYAFSENCSKNINFIKINKKIKKIPKIVEFFSFYCQYCYDFNIIQNIPQKIEKNLKEKLKIKYYHVSFLGKLGKELTTAWIIATILKKEEKIAPLIYQKIRKNKIKTKQDIENIFLKIGIKKSYYNIVKKSFIYKSLINQQKYIIKKIKLNYVPLILIKGKYIVCNNVILKKNIKKYIKIINFLIKK